MFSNVYGFYLLSIWLYKKNNICSKIVQLLTIVISNSTNFEDFHDIFPILQSTIYTNQTKGFSVIKTVQFGTIPIFTQE